MDIDERKPKTFARTWGATIVIAIFLVGTLVTTVFLVQQPLGRPIPTPGPSAIVGTGETEFTPNGIAYASSHRFVSINLTARPIPAAKLGLGERASGTIPANEFGNSLRIIDGTENTVLHFVSRITVSSRAGVIDRLVFTAEDLGPADVRRRLTGDVADLGIDRSAIVPLDSAIKAALRDGRGYSATLAPTTRFGAPISTHVACPASGFCTITYTADLTG
jgi:hypothetical protein